MTPIIVTKNLSGPRTRLRLPRPVGAGIVVGVLAALVASLPVALAGERAPTTFNGSCELSGTVRFKPPMTNEPQSGRVKGRLHGECTGTLTNRKGTRSIDGKRVKSRVHSSGLESCAAGRGEGAGYLKFGRSKLRFTYEEVRTGPVLVLDAAGAAGGSAVAEGNVSTSEDPGPILEACGSEGLRRAPVDVQLRTTPEISG